MIVSASKGCCVFDQALDAWLFDASGAPCLGYGSELAGKWISEANEYESGRGARTSVTYLSACDLISRQLGRDVEITDIGVEDAAPAGEYGRGYAPEYKESVARIDDGFDFSFEFGPYRALIRTREGLGAPPYREVSGGCAWVLTQFDRWLADQRRRIQRLNGQLVHSFRKSDYVLEVTTPRGDVENVLGMDCLIHFKVSVGAVEFSSVLKKHGVIMEIADSGGFVFKPPLNLTPSEMATLTDRIRQAGASCRA